MKQFGLIALLLNRYSQSLLCYDCYDTGPSNEKCIKTKNCTAEACLLYEGGDMFTTTAFCLFKLPDHYRKQNQINDAKCWLERYGRGMHCICLQNFCNQLRDRRVPLDGNMPLTNASLIKYNPLIDHDYASQNEADFKFDLTQLDDYLNNFDSDSPLKDLIPKEMGILNNKDVLEPEPSPSSNIPNTRLYEADEEKKRKQPDDISVTHYIHPDETPEEIKRTDTIFRKASTNINITSTFYILILLKLFFTFYV